MLILVTVSITMAVKGGLFKYAGDAVKGTKNAKEEEEKIAQGMIEIDGKVYSSIDEYTKGVKIIGRLSESDDPIEYQNGGKTAYIPKGFGIVEGCDTIENGLVISDEFNEDGESIGNEFVWIPVEIKETDTKTSIAAMQRTAWADNNPTTGLSTSYKEPHTSGYSTEAQEYNDMLESVYNHGGFYIGRYEVGSETPRYNTSNGTTTMSVKRGKYPYNYVGWGPAMNTYEGEVTDQNSLNQGNGAVKLSKDFYKGKDVGVTSTLIYGSQWDATLRFVKDDDHNVNNSTIWGNYNNNRFTFTGKYNTSPTGSTWNDAINRSKPNRNSYLLTTGASEHNKAKNIYDLAGNVREWTMESDSTSNRVRRGGNYAFDGYDYPASDRGSDLPTSSGYVVGFRVALYIP